MEGLIHNVVEEIKELMTLFNDSNMTEFHLSNEEFEAQFSKRESILKSFLMPKLHPLQTWQVQ